MKFEEAGNLGVMPGRGWIPIGTETEEVVSTAMVERASSSPCILQRVVHQCLLSWRFRDRQYEKFCYTF
ncbi:hypothetical protein TNCV_4351461 [Trichonephila clavipes]|nr:hypothetical protein TNCV_4351461 [Trichonephila clavipes]